MKKLGKLRDSNKLFYLSLEMVKNRFFLIFDKVVFMIFRALSIVEKSIHQRMYS